ncbi:MAG: TonB family protein [Nitrospira sp.]|nr:TonB family protein [Nitrospira sp.]
MTLAHSHGRASAINANIAGWVASVCVHGALALGAVFLLQRLQLAPDVEPFQWDVAMVEPVARPASQAATNHAPPTPPEPSRPATAPLQRTPSPTQPAPREMTAEPSRIEATPRPLPAPVAPVQPPPAPVQAAPPPKSEPAPQPPPQTSAPAKMDPAPEPVRAPLPTAPKLPMKSEDLPKPAPAVEAPAPAVSSSSHAPDQPTPPMESRPTSITALSAPSVTAPPPTGESLSQHTAPPQEMPAAQPTPAPTQDVATLAPLAQSKITKPDDGWLADLMGKWIQDLEKHYPASLRTEGVQGKVVLVAILHDDGTLSDVKVSKSSGNTLLDQAAVSDVEKGPPIHLSRPLGRPQRPIKFSISYDLKTGR